MIETQKKTSNRIMVEPLSHVLVLRTSKQLPGDVQHFLRRLHLITNHGNPVIRLPGSRPLLQHSLTCLPRQLGQGQISPQHSVSGEVQRFLPHPSLHLCGEPFLACAARQCGTTAVQSQSESESESLQTQTCDLTHVTCEVTVVCSSIRTWQFSN